MVEQDNMKLEVYQDILDNCKEMRPEHILDYIGEQISVLKNLEETRKRFREVNDKVKKSYIDRYETKHGVDLMEMHNGKYRELPYNSEVSLEQVICDVDEN